MCQPWSRKNLIRNSEYTKGILGIHEGCRLRLPDGVNMQGISGLVPDQKKNAQASLGRKPMEKHMLEDSALSGKRERIRHGSGENHSSWGIGKNQ